MGIKTQVVYADIYLRAMVGMNALAPLPLGPNRYQYYQIILITVLPS